MRPDMFPLFLVEAMKELCTDSPAHSIQQTREAFKDSFGVEIEDIFEEFGMSPIASGSVAQVYRAKLRPEFALADGQVEVAVKVRHPGVVYETFFDVDILFHFLSLGSYFSKIFAMPFDRNDFVQRLQKQVDMTYEAYNLERFTDNFRREVVGGELQFPSFSREILSPAVLVEKWAEGVVMTEFFVKVGDRFEVISVEGALDPSTTTMKSSMAITVFDAAMKMFLRDNLIHGDLHGGNVMYDAFNNKMTFIDVGIACTLEGEAGTEDFVRFLYGMCTAQSELIAGSLLDMAESPEKVVLDRKKFDLDISNALDLFVDPVSKKALLDGPAPVGDISGEVFRTLQKHEIYLRGDVTSLLVSVMMLEGLLRQLDPEFDMMTRAIPYILKYKPEIVANVIRK
jgi:aarF domain-containing kinase